MVQSPGRLIPRVCRIRWGRGRIRVSPGSSAYQQHSHHSGDDREQDEHMSMAAEAVGGGEIGGVDTNRV